MNPSLIQTDRPAAAEVSEQPLFSYLREFGSHSLAYSTLQPELDHFVLESLGYIAFRKWRGFTIVLGNPVCEARRRSLLLEQFLKEHPYPLFLHITTATAADLSQLGFVCNVMGMESFVDLETFTPTWRSHNALRESQRRFKKIGAEIFELPFSKLAEKDITTHQLERISELWLQARPGKAMRFLLRPLTFVDEPDTRVFLMRRNGKAVGFTIYDPIYTNGRVMGYCPNISRWNDADLPTGRSVAVNLHAAEVFRAEGRRMLALGLLPFEGDLRSPLEDSRVLRAAFLLSPQIITQFDFASLSRHKKFYKGALTHVFYATRRRGLNRLRELVAAGTLIGLI